MSRTSGVTTRQVAITISVAVHVIAASVLLYVRPWESPSPSANRQSSTGSGDGSGESTQTQPELTRSTSPEAVTGELVQEKLTSVLNTAESRSHDQNIEQLAGLISRLDGVASEDSLDELGVKMRQWLGSTERVLAPESAQEDAERFDSTTAMIDTVKRQRGKDGNWLYVARMIDANGLAADIEMDPEPGKRAYDTFRLIDSSPLARKLYQNIAVPLIDRRLQDDSSD